MSKIQNADLKKMKGVSERHQKMIADAETLLGPEPSEMGVVKNFFWGNLREELLFPYPQMDKVSADERRECDELVAKLKV